ncbi:HalOD1 output domain-containing protein [Halosolutus amylolyticus]|uniref:HalOD1 output domain-containing protein n=1 Tax=Halosolutus amylolyticus TaxID=2932267 RepID=A0ABD5PN43_9EURY|nr:HalOD1 output domain-containing protein [Halosolutus amylolyticus]
MVETILRGLARIEGVSRSELDPLYERVETDALAALLGHARDADCAVGVEFMTDDYTVRVSNDGRVYIHDGVPTVAPRR